MTNVEYVRSKYYIVEVESIKKSISKVAPELIKSGATTHVGAGKPSLTTGKYYDWYVNINNGVVFTKILPAGWRSLAKVIGGTREIKYLYTYSKLRPYRPHRDINPNWSTKPLTIIPTSGEIWFSQAQYINGLRVSTWTEPALFVPSVKDTTGIFVTNITPATTDSVVNIVYNSFPNDSSVDSISTDDTEVYVTVEWDRETKYQETPTINDVPITSFSSKTGGTYVTTVLVDISMVNQIICRLNQSTYIVEIQRDELPVIELARFTGGYPGQQTELKENDTFDFEIQADSEFDRIEFSNYGAYKPQTFNITAAVSTVINNVVIANRGNTTIDVGAQVRVRKPSGVWSEWYLTENHGVVDGEHLVKLNNRHPEIIIQGVNYPVGQQALKNTEEATVDHTINYFDTVQYTSPNMQLAITDSEIFQNPKTVARQVGNYNINTNNFLITANRAANDATSTASTIVKIAHVACTINVYTPTNRLRSGGNDGTNAQNHTITIQANQQLLQAPTLIAPEGTWQGGGFTGSGSNWTRSLQVHDNMTKGTYSWETLSAINLAGVETTTIEAGYTQYEIGGFVSRVIKLEAFDNEAWMQVAAVIYAKVILEWEVKDLPNKREIGTTATPDDGAWCLNSLETNPTLIRILDTEATNSSSQASDIIIEEIV